MPQKYNTNSNRKSWVYPVAALFGAALLVSPGIISGLAKRALYHGETTIGEKVAITTTDYPWPANHWDNTKMSVVVPGENTTDYVFNKNGLKFNREYNNGTLDSGLCDNSGDLRDNRGYMRHYTDNGLEGEEFCTDEYSRFDRIVREIVKE